MKKIAKGGTQIVTGEETPVGLDDLFKVGSVKNQVPCAQQQKTKHQIGNSKVDPDLDF